MPTSASVTADRCADASLYRPFDAAGLTGLTCFPQLVAINPGQSSRFAISQQQVLAALTAEEAVEWHSAATEAEAAGTFFISAPHHCAVGTKPA